MSPRRLRGLALVALAAAAVPACAYFNALYNAKRSYADARRAAARGDVSAAAHMYDDAIERAAESYRRDSTGHWSNEALELMGRAYFALADYGRAGAAFQHLLERGARGDRRAAAQAYLGASLVRSGQSELALPHLDSAAARLRPTSELGAFAYTWRARARFDAASPDAAWADLLAAGAASGTAGLEADLEAAARAIARNDSARAGGAFDRLLSRSDAAALADSVRYLAGLASRAWGPATARALLGPIDRHRWSTTTTLQVALDRARLAAAAGDTATALAEATVVGKGADHDVAGAARVAVARWRLASARDLTSADAVRGELLGAITVAAAQDLIRNLKMLDVLVSRASQGEPLSLFAAAELARDQLGAPVLARRLFETYADVVPTAVWAPKALMAAEQLADGAARDSIRERLQPLSRSVYVRAAAGEPVDSEFSDAETRLDRALTGARAMAASEAARRDAGVTRVVAVLDSVKAKARSDSLRITCGAFADSAGVTGVRGDTLRDACMKGDTAKVALLLKADTIKLADTTAVRRLVPGRRDARGVGRDSVK